MINESEIMKKRMDEFNWDRLEKFQRDSRGQNAEFCDMMDTVKTRLTVDVKKCRQKTSNLEYKYENLHMWSKMFNQIAMSLKDDLFRMTGENMNHIDRLIQMLDLQLVKDENAELDERDGRTSRGKRQHTEEAEPTN